LNDAFSPWHTDKIGALENMHRFDCLCVGLFCEIW